MRHYLIIDFRPKSKFNECYIRKSLNLDIESETLDEGLFSIIFFWKIFQKI